MTKKQKEELKKVALDRLERTNDVTILADCLEHKTLKESYVLAKLKNIVEGTAFTPEQRARAAFVICKHLK